MQKEDSFLKKAQAIWIKIYRVILMIIHPFIMFYWTVYFTSFQKPFLYILSYIGFYFIGYVFTTWSPVTLALVSLLPPYILAPMYFLLMIISLAHF